MNLKKLFLTMFIALSSVMSMMAYTVTVNTDGLTFRGTTVSIYVGDADVPTATLSRSTTSWTNDLEEGEALYLEAANPATTYVFVGWYNGEDLLTTQNIYEFDIAGDITVTAKYELYVEKYKLTVKSNNVEWGTTTGTGLYAANSIVEISATPEDGYQFVTWEDGNKNATRNVEVTEAMTIYATFAEIAKYTIDAYANNVSYGTVTGGDIYQSNADVTITATAKPGYRFVAWQDGNTDATRNFKATQNKTYIATFELIPVFDVEARPANGSWGSTTGGAEGVVEGTIVTISATPKAGYQFDGWDDGNTDNPRTVTVGTKNLMFYANFSEIRYELTLLVNDPAMGAVVGAGTYSKDANVTISATANPEYEFVRWSDGETATVRTVTMNESKTLTAEFVSIHADEVEMTITSAGFATFAPQENVIVPEGLDVYYVSSFTASEITLRKVTPGTAVCAGEGFHVVGAEGTYYWEKTSEPVEKIANNKFVGLMADQTFNEEATIYFLTKNGYKLNNAGRTLKKGQAYLPVSAREEGSAAAPDGVLRIRFAEDGENTATDLETLEGVELGEKVMVDGKIYIKREGHMFTVSGQMVK